MDTTMINVRISKQTKGEAEKVFSELGLTMTSAITVFLKAVVREKAIPFYLGVPNKETLESFKEIEDIKSGKKQAKIYKNTKELKKDLGI